MLYWMSSAAKVILVRIKHRSRIKNNPKKIVLWNKININASFSSALTYPQLVEAHNIIQEETVYQKFVDLLEECAMDDSSWPQIIARIYELIQAQKPDVWEKLGLLLDRVSRSRYNFHS